MTSPGFGWRTPGSVMDADFANGRYYWNQQAFPDETTFNAAIGATKSGNVRTFGPYVDPAGTDIAVNGDMSDGTTGFAAFGTGASIANVSNELELTCGGAALGGFLQPVTGYAGRAFRTQITGRRGTNATSISLVAARDAAAAGLHGIGAANISGTSNATITGTASIGPDPTYVGVRDNSNSAGTFLFDNLSMVECWPFKGWTHNAFAVVIDAVAASSHAAQQTLWQGDAGGADNTRIWIYRDTDGNIKVDIRAYASATATFNLGNVADSTEENPSPITVALSGAPNNVVASLNGGAPSIDTSVTLPGCAYMRVGNNIAGNTGWTGSINRVTVF